MRLVYVAKYSKNWNKNNEYLSDTFGDLNDLFDITTLSIICICFKSHWASVTMRMIQLNVLSFYLLHPQEVARL